MIDDLATAILNKYTATGALVAAIPSFYFTQAPQTVSDETYATYSWVGSGTEEYMGQGTTSKMEKAEIRFMVFNTTDDGGITLASAMSLLMATYDWTKLTIPDHTAVAFERTGTASVEYIDDIWIGTVNYTAWFDG